MIRVQRARLLVGDLMDGFLIWHLYVNYIAGVYFVDI